MKRSNFDITLTYMLNRKESLAFNAIQNVEYPDQHNCILFLTAARHGYISILNWFIQTKNLNDSIKNKAIICAIKEEKINVLEELLKLPKINVSIDDLKLAIGLNNHKIISLLLFHDTNNVSMVKTILKIIPVDKKIVKLIEQAFIIIKARNFLKVECLKSLGLCNDLIELIIY